MRDSRFWSALGGYALDVIAIDGAIARALQERHTARAAVSPADVEPDATERSPMLRDGLLTRPEVAAYLRVSTRKVQRMEVAGQLQRCPNLGTVVRYAARDVLRLASASSRKGA